MKDVSEAIQFSGWIEKVERQTADYAIVAASGKKWLMYVTKDDRFRAVEFTVLETAVETAKKDDARNLEGLI